MIIKFYIRAGYDGDAKEVARAISKVGGLSWSGDKGAIKAIKDTLISDRVWRILGDQQFDEDNSAHVAKIPHIFAGAYAWAEIEKSKIVVKGGKGSGNFGHGGRPGKVGGSAKGTGSNDYIDFSTQSNYEDVNKWWDDKVSEISKDEEKAIRDYAGSGFRDVNAVLRKPKDSDDLSVRMYYSERSDHTRKSVDYQVEHLDAVMGKSVLQDNITTYRFDAFTDYTKMEPGTRFVDKGYVSTSVYPKFIIQGSAVSGGTALVIKVAAGAKAAYIGKHGNPIEFELLLDRNTVFVYDGMDNQGRVMLHVEK